MTHIQMHGKSISSIVWDYDYRGNKYRCIFYVKKCKSAIFFFLFHPIIFIHRKRRIGRASFESSKRIQLFQITIHTRYFHVFLIFLIRFVELITCVRRLLWYNSWRSLNIFNDHPVMDISRNRSWLISISLEWTRKRNTILLWKHDLSEVNPYHRLYLSIQSFEFTNRR